MKQSIILSKSESMIFLRDSPFELDDIEYRRNIFRKNKERVFMNSFYMTKRLRGNYPINMNNQII